jgi:hypothetical protein
MVSQSPKKKYVFFVSHSTKDVSDDVGEICEIFEKCRIQSFIADRDAPLGNPLPQEIKKAIEESELFLVFLTTNSRKSPWVNQEIGYALGKEIPVIPLKKRRIKVKGLIESAKYVQMRDNPLDTVKEIFSRLEATPLSRTAEAAIGAVVGVLELKDKYGGVEK